MDADPVACAVENLRRAFESLRVTVDAQRPVPPSTQAVQHAYSQRTLVFTLDAIEDELAVLCELLSLSHR